MTAPRAKFARPDLQHLGPSTPASWTRRARRWARSRLNALRGRHAVFRNIYERNLWADAESRSGEGSSRIGAAQLRETLPGLLEEIGVRSLVDAPCGDFNWMADLDLPLESYIGIDIVREIVVRNRELHGRPGRRFMVRDLVSDDLPRADAILCRDVFVHLSLEDACDAVDNIRRMGYRYLLATTFTDVLRNRNIVTGQWRALDLEREPFRLGKARLLVEDQGGDRRAPSKRRGLWDLSEVAS
jgi:hypothetical protein